MFTHVVLFWLKETTTSDQRDAIARDCDEKLRKIPGVEQLHVGRPANTPRETVDNSYDIGLCILYADKAGHDAYQDHPHHVAFLTTHRAQFKRVQIYDFV